MELQELSWLCLVGLFLASLVIVLGWLFQYSLTVLRLWRARKAAKRHGRDPAWRQHPNKSLAGALWGFLLKLRSGRDGRPTSEAGVKGLLTSLFSFKSFRELFQRTWVKALNEQACRHGSSIQITFDSSLQISAASAIESVSCTDQSANRMILHCNCSVDRVTLPVTVTQQSPAAISMDTYQITIAPVVAKVVACLEEVEDEGLLISWSLSKQPSFSLTVSPCKLQRRGTEGEADIDTIKGLIEDTLFSTQPAMVLNLRTSSPLAPMDSLSVAFNSVSQSVLVRRLLLRQLRATLSKGQWSKSGELCCVLSLDQPSTERTTRFLPVPSSANAALEWSEDITLELGPETKELRVRLLERSGKREQFLPGHASIALDIQGKVPTGQHVLSMRSGQDSTPNAVITAELLYQETEEPSSAHKALLLRSSLTPTKKVDVDRTIMPDGTIVTTVTTVQSRLKLDRSPGDSPLRSPSKVEVNEKKPTVLPDSRRSSSPNPSKSSRLSNGLDPVAETAIRQLTESASRAARKTPTKRSTLIISGVSKVPLSEDNCALSSGYAAAMDAAMHGNHYGSGRQHDPDETTPSDVSERPSVDDVESDTGSTGALETRSLKDHKVGFLQSGTKLLFRRRHREKESCLSQSHEDISNLGNNFTAAPNISRKKSGSFSRRLIKRFSFRSSGKSKGKAANGGASALDN
ncbi:RNA-binding protein 25 [Sarotherodon galilaeus]